MPDIEVRPILGIPVKKMDPPVDVSEETEINGFVFSARLLKAAKIQKLDLPTAVALGKTRFALAGLAKQIASDSDGGPTIGENSIQIRIDAADANAGSTADYIWMYFGRDRKIKLWGVEHDRFPKGATLTWQLNGESDFLETIPPDAWDEISLVTDSGDGMKIAHIVIEHSSVTILDWTVNDWLDASTLERHSRIGLAAPMLTTKLGQIGNRWKPQLHWAARELGKTDGRKYGTTSEWCSEFASWCLRKGLWGTPAGNIGSADMEDYFQDRGRKYSRAQILSKTYTLFEGDYLRFEWDDGGHHSGLFLYYVDDASNPTEQTRIKTIEGNTGSRVAVKTRTLHDVISVGNTR